MMWAIFCPLAFCAFQMIFARELEEDIFESQFAQIKLFSAVQDKAFSDVSAAAQAVKIKKMKWPEVFERCTSTDFDQRFAKSYTDKCPILDQCYLKVKNTKDIQTAENCCKKLLAELKEDAKSFLPQAKKCIAKCAQDETKCLEELKNIRKREDKEYQNSIKNDTKNV